MGCFLSKNADTKASRIARWRATGIVALRDSKLKILAENFIERLPVSLGKLQSLKLMNLDGNRITSLPDELDQLVRLERLSVSRNLLASLPVTIGSLRNLVLLNVSNNKLQSLPESVGSCSSLEELQANDNLIEDLPSSVCNLSHLKSLCLDNNNVKQQVQCCFIASQFDHGQPRSNASTREGKNVGEVEEWKQDLIGNKPLKTPLNLLKDCKALQNISLHGNPISMDQLQQMEGFQEFEARRKKKFDKQIDSNVMIGSKGLDEGVDL
ncbi:hypothetical protein ACSQ67_019737 [Phaseolus vulgaris]